MGGDDVAREKVEWVCPDPSCGASFKAALSLHAHIYRLHLLPLLLETRMPHAVPGQGCWCGQVHEHDFERIESLFNMRRFARDFAKRQQGA